VLKDLSSLAAKPELINELAQRANKEFGAKQPSYADSLAANRRQREAIVKSLDKVTDNALAAVSDADQRMWSEKGHRLQTQHDQLDKEMETLKARAEERKTSLLDAGAIKAAL